MSTHFCFSLRPKGRDAASRAFRLPLVAVVALLLAFSNTLSATVVIDQNYPRVHDSLASLINECCAYIGQTYTAGITGTLSGVSVSVTLFTSLPLHIAIRTTQNGLPTTTVLGETDTSLVQHSDRVIDMGTASLDQIITFPQAISQVAGVQYAIVINIPGAISQGAGHSLGAWTGEAGPYAVPYPGGVSVFSYDQGQTWSAVPPLSNHFRTYVDVRDVPVDIKPMTCPNPLNTRSNGVLPVAILGSPGWDVRQVDVATVRLQSVPPSGSSLGDVAAPYVGTIPAQPVATACTAAGPDGQLDLLLHFDSGRISAALGPVADGEVRVLRLTGKLLSGESFFGQDVVTIKAK